MLISLFVSLSMVPCISTSSLSSQRSQVYAVPFPLMDTQLIDISVEDECVWGCHETPLVGQCKVEFTRMYLASNL